MQSVRIQWIERFEGRTTMGWLLWRWMSPCVVFVSPLSSSSLNWMLHYFQMSHWTRLPKCQWCNWLFSSLVGKVAGREGYTLEALCLFLLNEVGSVWVLVIYIIKKIKQKISPSASWIYCQMPNREDVVWYVGVTKMVLSTLLLFMYSVISL